MILYAHSFYSRSCFFFYQSLFIPVFCKCLQCFIFIRGTERLCGSDGRCNCCVLHERAWPCTEVGSAKRGMLNGGREGLFEQGRRFQQEGNSRAALQCFLSCLLGLTHVQSFHSLPNCLHQVSLSLQDRDPHPDAPGCTDIIYHSLVTLH